MKLEKIVSLNPSKNYEQIGSIDISTSAEIKQKVANARVAQPGWARLGFKGRNALLEKLYQEFKKKKNQIALIASQEMGMPVSMQDKIDFDGAGFEYMRGYLDFAEQWLAPQIIFEDEKEIHYRITMNGRYEFPQTESHQEDLQDESI